MILTQYKCEFTVNGTRTSQIVSTRSAAEAKQLIERQYNGYKIVWWRWEKLR